MEKICVSCNKAFEAEGKRKICNECKKEYNKKRQHDYAVKTGKFTLKKKNCKICGNEFETYRSTQVCCSKECSEKNNTQFLEEYANNNRQMLREKRLKHYYEKERQPVKDCTCVFCKKQFLAEHKRKYCTKDCEKKQRNAKRSITQIADAESNQNINFSNQGGYTMNNLTKVMIDHLNLKLKDEGSVLRYVEKLKDGNTTSYRIIVADKFVDNDYNSPNITDEFEKYVRNFFKENYNVDKTGFTNTVTTLFVTEVSHVR